MGSALSKPKNQRIAPSEDESAISWLKAHGFESFQTVMPNGDSVLHAAARLGDCWMCEYLLAHGGLDYLKIPNSSMQTPLMVAVEAGHLLVCNILFEESGWNCGHDGEGDLKSIVHTQAISAGKGIDADIPLPRIDVPKTDNILIGDDAITQSNKHTIDSQDGCIDNQEPDSIHSVENKTKTASQEKPGPLAPHRSSCLDPITSDRIQHNDETPGLTIDSKNINSSLLLRDHRCPDSDKPQEHSSQPVQGDVNEASYIPEESIHDKGKKEQMIASEIDSPQVRFLDIDDVSQITNNHLDSDENHLTDMNSIKHGFIHYSELNTGATIISTALSHFEDEQSRYGYGGKTSRKERSVVRQ